MTRSGGQGQRSKSARRKPARSKSPRAKLPVRLESSQKRGSPASVPAAAIKAWQLLSRVEQIAMLEEIVMTRRQELMQAYGNVVAMAYGYGTWRPRNHAERADQPQTPAERRREKRKGGEVLGLVFIVKRKHDDPRRVPAKHLIPHYILTYVTLGGVRTLCAVPTDVESADEYRPVAQNADPANVWVTRQPPQPPMPPPFTRGACAALVRVPGLPPEQEYLLSCRHVFGMSMDDEGEPHRPRRAVRWARVDGQAIATPQRYAGLLTNDTSACFDAALALVLNGAGIRDLARRAVLARPVDFTREYADLPTLFVHTPRSSAAIKVVSTNRWWSMEIDYGKLGKLVHGEVVELVTERHTLPGDSGSPVTDSSGLNLAGMLIAGPANENEARRSFMIPAWKLLSLNEYAGLAELPGQPNLEFVQG